MVKKGILKHLDLSSDTKLYRYMSLKQFMSFVENKTIYLTKVKNWEDTWEAPASRIPMLNNDYEVEYPLWEDTEIMYGMCFSSNKESDALWRIYSPNKDGIQIETSVKKFDLLQEIQYGFLAPVIYYDDLLRALNDMDCNPDYKRPFAKAFLKRKAFIHESEVRLVTRNEESCIEQVHENNNVINLHLNPIDFIEKITVDPRADDWYVEMLKKYCDRLKLVEPTKSTLYSDVYGQSKIVKKFVPVE